MAENAKKFLDYEGLQYFIGKLVAGEVKGKGLSANDFTDELLAKLNSTATTAGLESLTTDVNKLKALIEADSDGAINKFNEIVAFLAGIEDTKTLNGLLGDISTQIAGKVSPADLKAATFAAGKFTAKGYTPTTAATINVPTNTSHLTNDSNFITLNDVPAITNAEIDALIAA